jgi:hypothetical protein
MHPVKAEGSDCRGVSRARRATFSLDSMEELEKIVRATGSDEGAAQDLNLCVRIRVSSDHSKLSLAAKFGAEPHEVKELLMAARPGVGRARHLLPRRQPGDDSGGLFRSDGAGARGYRQRGRDGRHR